MMLLKIIIAIMVAIIAALTVVIAGMSSDISSGTVMLRAVFAFAITGFGLISGVILLERYGIPLYLKKGKEPEKSEWLKLYLLLKSMEKQAEKQEETAPQEENELMNEEPRLVDLSVDDNMASITEDELESLSAETATITAEEMDELTRDISVEDQIKEETRQAIKESEQKQKEELTFTPLSVENMTRMTLPQEEAHA